MVSAFSVVSLHLIFGQFNNWLGATSWLLGALLLQHDIRRASTSGHVNYSNEHAHTRFVRLVPRAHRFDYSRRQRAVLGRE